MAKLLRDAKEEVDRLRALESTYTVAFPKYDSDPIRARELSEWQFALNKKWKVYERVTSPKVLEAYPEVAELHAKLVESNSLVSSKEFWQRYYYWCDEKRWVKELQRRKEEQVKERLLPRPSSNSSNMEETATTAKATSSSDPSLPSNNTTTKRVSVKSSSTNTSQSSLAPAPTNTTIKSKPTMDTQPVNTSHETTSRGSITYSKRTSAVTPVGAGLKDRLQQWNKATTTSTSTSTRTSRTTHDNESTSDKSSNVDSDATSAAALKTIPPKEEAAKVKVDTSSTAPKEETLAPPPPMMTTSTVGLGLKDRLKQWNSATTTTTSTSPTKASSKVVPPVSPVKTSQRSWKNPAHQVEAAVVPKKMEVDTKEPIPSSFLPNTHAVTPVAVGLTDRLQQWNEATSAAVLETVPSSGTPPSVGVPARLKRWSQQVSTTTSSSTNVEKKEQVRLKRWSQPAIAATAIPFDQSTLLKEEEEEEDVPSANTPPAPPNSSEETIVTSHTGSPLGLGLKDRLKQWGKATETTDHPVGGPVVRHSSPKKKDPLPSTTTTTSPPKTMPPIETTGSINHVAQSVKDRMKTWGSNANKTVSNRTNTIDPIRHSVSEDSEVSAIAPSLSFDKIVPSLSFDKKSARAEVDRRRKMKETYLEPLSSTADSFVLEFRREFNHRAKERATALQMYPDTVAAYFRSMVPKKVSEKDFWARYYFRCDIERISIQGGEAGPPLGASQSSIQSNKTKQPTTTSSSRASFAAPIPKRTSAPEPSYASAKLKPSVKINPTPSSSNKYQDNTSLYDTAKLKSSSAAKQSTTTSSINPGSTTKRASLKTVRDIKDLEKPKERRSSVLPAQDLQTRIEDDLPEIDIPPSAIEKKEYLISLYTSLETVKGTPTRLSMSSQEAAQQVQSEFKKQLLFDEETSTDDIGDATSTSPSAVGAESSANETEKEYPELVVDVPSDEFHEGIDALLDVTPAVSQDVLDQEKKQAIRLQDEMTSSVEQETGAAMAEQHEMTEQQAPTENDSPPKEQQDIPVEVDTTPTESDTTEMAPTTPVVGSPKEAAELLIEVLAPTSTESSLPKEHEEVPAAHENQGKDSVEKAVADPTLKESDDTGVTAHLAEESSTLISKAASQDEPFQPLLTDSTTKEFQETSPTKKPEELPYQLNQEPPTSTTELQKQEEPGLTDLTKEFQEKSSRATTTEPQQTEEPRLTDSNKEFQDTSPTTEPQEEPHHQLMDSPTNAVQESATKEPKEEPHQLTDSPTKEFQEPTTKETQEETRLTDDNSQDAAAANENQGDVVEQSRYPADGTDTAQQPVEGATEDLADHLVVAPTGEALAPTSNTKSPTKAPEQESSTEVPVADVNRGDSVEEAVEPTLKESDEPETALRSIVALAEEAQDPTTNESPTGAEQESSTEVAVADENQADSVQVAVEPTLKESNQTEIALEPTVAPTEEPAEATLESATPRDQTSNDPSKDETLEQQPKESDSAQDPVPALSPLETMETPDTEHQVDPVSKEVTAIPSLEDATLVTETEEPWEPVADRTVQVPSEAKVDSALTIVDTVESQSAEQTFDPPGTKSEVTGEPAESVGEVLNEDNDAISEGETESALLLKSQEEIKETRTDEDFTAARFGLNSTIDEILDGIPSDGDSATASRVDVDFLLSETTTGAEELDTFGSTWESTELISVVRVDRHEAEGENVDIPSPELSETAEPPRTTSDTQSNELSQFEAEDMRNGTNDDALAASSTGKLESNDTTPVTTDSPDLDSDAPPAIESTKDEIPESEEQGLGLLDRMFTTILSSCGGDLQAIGSGEHGEVKTPTTTPRDKIRDEESTVADENPSPVSLQYRGSTVDESKNERDQHYYQPSNTGAPFESALSGDSFDVNTSMDQSVDQSIDTSFSNSLDVDGSQSIMSKSKTRRLRRQKAKRASLSQRMLSESTTQGDD